MIDFRKLVSLGCIAGFTLQAGAATVAWDAASDNTDGGDIVGGGTVVLAHNGGPEDATPFMVGDVDFVSGAISTLTSTHQGGVGGGDFLSASTGDANYDRLLTSVAYGAAANITVEGLSIGTDYVAQFFYNDQRLPDRNLLFHDGDAGNVASLSAAGGNNAGQYVLGYFTADATNQLFSVNGDWDGGVNADFTAAVVREVPEPASFTLIGLGGLALVGRRK